MMEISSFPTIFEEIQNTLPLETSIAIADPAKYIYYQPSRSIDLKIKPGDLIKEGTISLKTFREKKKVSQFVDQDIFGVPYYGISIPIHDGGELNGCITVIVPPGNMRKDLNMPRHPFVIGKAADCWVPISFEKIKYIHSTEGRTQLHTKEGIFENKFNLLELESILPREQFIRCHRAYIVNISMIEEIQPHFHSTFLLSMKGQEKQHVPVSQKYSSYFRQFLGF